MPEEVFVIAMTALIGGAGVMIAIVRSIAGYHKAKLQSMSRASSGDGMTASELQRLVRSAVAESVEPLVEKLDRLESHLDVPRAPQALKEPAASVLLDEFDEPAEAEPVVPRGRIR